MRALVWRASLTFLPACTGGSDQPPSDSVASKAATVSTSGGMDAPSVTVALTPELIAQAEAMAANSRALDLICQTLPIDASLTARRPGGTGCPRDSVDAQEGKP